MMNSGVKKKAVWPKYRTFVSHFSSIGAPMLCQQMPSLVFFLVFKRFVAGSTYLDAHDDVRMRAAVRSERKDTHLPVLQNFG